MRQRTETCRVNVDSYRGFIFGNLNPEAGRLDDYLGDTRTFIDLIAGQSPQGLEVLRGSSTYRFRGNWKLQAENGVDGYHFTVHANFAQLAGRRNVRSDDKVKAIDGRTIMDLASGCYDALILVCALMIQALLMGKRKAPPTPASRSSLRSPPPAIQHAVPRKSAHRRTHRQERNAVEGISPRGLCAKLKKLASQPWKKRKADMRTGQRAQGHAFGCPNGMECYGIQRPFVCGTTASPQLVKDLVAAKQPAPSSRA